MPKPETTSNASQRPLKAVSEGDLVWIKPVENRLVRDRFGFAIDDSGVRVAWGPHWLRRLNDGDIELTGAPAEFFEE